MGLTVQVVTPEREVTGADDVSLVVAKGVEGDVGIMPGHAPLLIALGSGILTVVHEDGARHEMAVAGGFLQVFNDSVIVLGEHVFLPHEIEPDRIRAEYEQVRRELEGAPEDPGARERFARARAAIQLVERM